ncbi:MAG: Mrp/NBP35 family ATP-binding protein [Gemmatimonadaceae bacterium]|nr:Mrp/NBP35 family ATP-binding protein [Gemmatimonadaceae bacterium]
MQTRIAQALQGVVNPRTSEDVIRSGMIRDVAVSVEGRVRFTILLDAQDPASLVREVRQAAERVDGVSDVRVDVRDPSQSSANSAVPPVSRGAPPSPPPAFNPPKGRSLPVMGQEPKPRAAVPPAPTPVTYPNLGRILAISSGKGGVGKSTVSVNLAVALAQQGLRVGLMDADVYGPNIPMMMGVNSPPPVVGDRIQTLNAHGVKLMSLGFLIERDQPAIWRGPIVMKIVTQFLRDVDWGTLDYLLVDMPPGTGDAQLSLVQATHVHGAIIVTTPQPVSTGDALRGAKMFERVNVPVLGIVENMSYLLCAHCGKPTPLFGSGGGKALADELNVPLLGEIPLEAAVREGGDSGSPIIVASPDSPAAKVLNAIATRVIEAAGAIKT